MDKTKFIHNLCEKLGKNNKAIYTVMAIASCKGIVRPTLSLTDKKESPDSRKYAALREIMTEFTGVPTTFGLGMLGEHLAKYVAKPGTQSFKNAQSIMSFLGICLAAAYFVPKFCNMSMPPIMKKLMPGYDPNTGATTIQQPQSPQVKQKIQPQNVNFSSLSSTFIHSGMRV